MGIGISSFTRDRRRRPRPHSFDIAGIKMFDSCEIRIHPPLARQLRAWGRSRKARVTKPRLGRSSRRNWVYPWQDITVEEGDTDTAPYGLGTYASRSTPVAGGATAMAARKIRDKARKIAAHLLEVSEEDLDWEPGKFFVKGAPSKAKTIQDIAFAAYPKISRRAWSRGWKRSITTIRPILTFPVRHLYLRSGYRQRHG